MVAAIAARSGLQEALWIPNVTGKPIVDVALLAVAVFVSVKIGRGPKWAAWAATALGVLAVVSVLGANRSYFYRVDYSQTSIAVPGVMTDPSGREIDNIFAFNAAGKFLGPVFLFDQNGFPLDVGNATALQANGVSYVSGRFPQSVLVTNSLGQTRAVQPRPPRGIDVPQLGSSNGSPASSGPSAGGSRPAEPTGTPTSAAGVTATTTAIAPGVSPITVAP